MPEAQELDGGHARVGAGGVSAVLGSRAHGRDAEGGEAPYAEPAPAAQGHLPNQGAVHCDSDGALSVFEDQQEQAQALLRGPARRQHAARLGEAQAGLEEARDERVEGGRGRRVHEE